MVALVHSNPLGILGNRTMYGCPLTLESAQKQSESARKWQAQVEQLGDKVGQFLGALLKPSDDVGGPSYPNTPVPMNHVGTLPCYLVVGGCK